ncbi:RING-H2 finger protein ATL8-like [Miscanthus floridulus]|uniref:RING-H2 finger protein ATL8-like n=1 Tax=Miscanthus floridulus TaxID=154761 RepID=UPI003458B8DF
MVELTVSVLLLVAGVVAMLVLHILIVVWALRRGVVLRAAASRRQDEERAAGGLSAEDLNELPCHDHECSKAGAGAGAECAVCQEAFQAGDRCRVLPRCEHGFHAQCVDQWLRKSRVCPVCRAEVGRGKAAGAVAGPSLAVVTERRRGADR